MKRLSILSAALLVVFGVSAQEAANKAEEAKPQATEQAEEKAAEPAKPAGSEAAKPAADAKKPADARATPQKFIPSEQVRSDFDVSFPVDI